MIEGIIAAIVGVLAGVGGTVVYDRQRKAGGKHKADQTIAEAKTKASDIVLKAKDDALKLTEEAKKEEARKEEKKEEPKKEEVKESKTPLFLQAGSFSTAQDADGPL